MIENINDSDYKLQMTYEKLLNIKKHESLNEKEENHINSEIRDVNERLLNKYITLNTVYNNTIINNKNILFPMFDEILAHNQLNRFYLSTEIDNNIKYNELIPDNIYAYQQVINELLTRKLSFIDEFTDKVKANLIRLGWDPETNEVSVSSEKKDRCRNFTLRRLTKEINCACTLINCSDIVPYFNIDKCNYSDIHPYYIVISNTDDNYRYNIYKDSLKSFDNEDSAVSIYLFFSKNVDLVNDNWKSEEYNIKDNFYFPYKHFMNNLMVARMVRSFKEQFFGIDFPMIVKVVGEYIRLDVYRMNCIERFANYCIATDNSEIIVNNRNHIISPLTYTTMCMNIVFPED